MQHCDGRARVAIIAREPLEPAGASFGDERSLVGIDKHLRSPTDKVRVVTMHVDDIRGIVVVPTRQDWHLRSVRGHNGKVM